MLGLKTKTAKAEDRNPLAVEAERLAAAFSPARRPAALQLAETNVRKLRSERARLERSTSELVREDWSAGLSKPSAAAAKATKELADLNEQISTARKNLAQEREKAGGPFKASLGPPGLAAKGLLYEAVDLLEAINQPLLDANAFAKANGFPVTLLVSASPQIANLLREIRGTLNRS